LSKQGIVLFAHGSRDPGWARPFEQLASILRKKTGSPVALAYLEQMRPTLGEAIDDLARQVTSVRVVPVFLGPGGHVKEDLPRLVDSIRSKHHSLAIEIDAAVGDQPAVMEAIANAIARK
jgi:sirohydrochlorin cobaltochelatase